MGNINFQAIGSWAKASQFQASGQRWEIVNFMTNAIETESAVWETNLENQMMILR